VTPHIYVFCATESGVFGAGGVGEVLAVGSVLSSELWFSLEDQVIACSESSVPPACCCRRCLACRQHGISLAVPCKHWAS